MEHTESIYTQARGHTCNIPTSHIIIWGNILAWMITEKIFKASARLLVISKLFKGHASVQMYSQGSVILSVWMTSRKIFKAFARNQEAIGKNIQRL